MLVTSLLLGLAHEVIYVCPAYSSQLKFLTDTPTVYSQCSSFAPKLLGALEEQ